MGYCGLTYIFLLLVLALLFFTFTGTREGYVLDNHQCDSVHPCPLGQHCAYGPNVSAYGARGRGICLTSPSTIEQGECAPGVAPCPPGKECTFYGTYYGCT